MAGFARIRTALMQGLAAAELGLPLLMPNGTGRKPDANRPWAMAHVIHALPTPATLGAAGEDAHSGILQVDLNYPLKSGLSDALTTADRAADFFHAGRRLGEPGAWVTITACGYTPGREIDGWYRLSLTVTWSARVPRPSPNRSPYGQQ